MAEPLIVTVAGRPAPQGSKKHIGHGRMIESSKRLPSWRESVKQAALNAIAASGWTRLEGVPVDVEAVFTVDRPASAPKRRRTWPITRSSGDLDKLLRAVLDAITEAGAIKDDAQVVTVTARKDYTTAPGSALIIPGAVIAISEVSG